MAGETLSEGQTQTLEEGAAKPLTLSRRAFLKGLGGAAAGSILEIPPAKAVRETIGFGELWEVGKQVYNLHAITDSIQVAERNGVFDLTFVTRRTDIQSQADQSQHPYARASRVNLTFADRKSAFAVGRFMRGINIVGDKLKGALQATSLVGAAGVLGIGNLTDEQKGKLKMVGGTALITASLGLFAGGLAACKAASDLYADATQTPEGTPGINGLGTLEPGSTPGPGPTVEVQVSPIPEIPTNFSGQLIDVNYLLTNGEILASSSNNSDLQPQPTPIPSPEVPAGEASGIVPIEYTKKVFGLREFKTDNPMDVLKYVVAQGARQGTDGGVTYYQSGLNGEVPAFSELSLYRERLEIPQDAAFQGEYTVQEGYPQGLVLKNGAGITVIGREENGNIVVAFEENLPRGSVETFFEPRMRFASLSANEFGVISKNFLKNAKYIIGEDHLTYTDPTIPSGDQTRTVVFNTLSNDLLTQIHINARLKWSEKYAANTDTGFSLFPNPTIPYRPRDDKKDLTLADIREQQKLRLVEKDNPQRVGHPRSKTFQVFNDKEELKWIVEYNMNRKEWEWKGPNWKNTTEMLNFLYGDTVLASFPYDDSNFQRVLAENFTMLNPGGFMVEGYDIYGWQRDLFSRLTRDNDQSLVIQPLFWQNMLPSDIYHLPTEQFKTWMRDRVKKIFDYIKPVEPGGKPTILVLGNEFLFWRNPKDGTLSDPVVANVDGVWTINPFSRVFGSSDKALEEIYMMAAQEAQSRDLRMGTDFIPIYSDFNNHSIDVTGSKTRELTTRLQNVKERVAQRLGITRDEVLLGVAIQGNYFFDKKILPEWITPPPTVDQLREAIVVQQQVGPVLLIDLNIQGLEQAEKVVKLKEYIQVVLDTGCMGLTLWRSLLSNKRPEDISDPVYEVDQANLFDPTKGYKPIPGNGYEDITQIFLSTAKARNLIG